MLIYLQAPTESQLQYLRSEEMDSSRAIIIEGTLENPASDLPIRLGQHRSDMKTMTGLENKDEMTVRDVGCWPNLNRI